MSQITKDARVQPVPSDESYGRAITLSLAFAAAVIVAAFLLTRPPVAVPAGGAGASQLTDGFLRGAIAAHTAQQIRDAQALTDGWQARLTTPAGAAYADVRDGWEGSLVGTMQTSQSAIRDGWEAGLVPQAVRNQDVRDGWESSLFR